MSTKKKILKQLGLGRNRKKIEDNERFNAAIKELLNRVSASQLMIFDVGAHRGESVQKYKKIFPDAIIHSFEPDPENFKKLVDNCANLSGVFCNNLAIGASNGVKKFYRTLKTSNSSFNKINTKSDWSASRSSKYSVNPEDLTTKSFDVEMRTLDDYVQERRIDRIHLLKLDTQGYEDECLKGALDTLRNTLIDIIVTEIILGDVYEKSLSFSDIENIIRQFGYRFVGLRSPGNLIDNPAYYTDLIYARAELLER